MGYTQEQADEMRQRTEAARKNVKPQFAGKGTLTEAGTAIVNAVTFLEKIKTKRIKQDTKPLMNKLETDWFNILNAQFPNFPRPRAQAKTYRLANGTKFTPDVTASIWPDAGGPAKETAWEVKGKHSWDDSIVKLKVAASVWPEVNWWLCWKVKGVWQTQKILP